MRNTLQTQRLLDIQNAAIFFKRCAALVMMLGAVLTLCISLGCGKEKESAQTSQQPNALPQTEADKSSSSIKEIALTQFTETQDAPFSWKHHEGRMDATNVATEQQNGSTQSASLLDLGQEPNSGYEKLFTIVRLPPVQFSSQTSPSLQLSPLPSQGEQTEMEEALKETTGPLVLDLGNQSTKSSDSFSGPTVPEEPQEKELFSMFGVPSIPVVSQEETLAVENAKSIDIIAPRLQVSM